MNSKTELPLIKPVYSATHGQGTVTSILHSNPSIINWYLNSPIRLLHKSLHSYAKRNRGSRQAQGF